MLRSLLRAEDTYVQKVSITASRMRSRLTKLKGGMPSLYSDRLLDSGPQLVKLSRRKARQADRRLWPCVASSSLQ